MAPAYKAVLVAEKNELMSFPKDDMTPASILLTWLATEALKGPSNSEVYRVNGGEEGFNEKDVCVAETHVNPSYVYASKVLQSSLTAEKRA